MSPRPTTPEPSPRRLLLKRMDQTAIAGLTLAALVSIGAYWLVQGGASGRLIEIDRAPLQTVHFQLDVNQADWPEISVLPEVGETLARRIVESRTADGPFADLDELQRVRGIGPKTLERIRPYLRPLPGAASTAGQ